MFIPSSSSPSFGFPPTWSTDAPVNLCQAPDKPELDLKQSTLFCSIADSLQLPLEALQCTLVAQRWSCALVFFFCYTTFTVLLFFKDSATTGAAIQSPVVISPP